jgi:osmotically-inducible protein OsmY
MYVHVHRVRLVVLGDVQGHVERALHAAPDPGKPAAHRLLEVGERIELQRLADRRPTRGLVHGIASFGCGRHRGVRCGDRGRRPRARIDLHQHGSGSRGMQCACRISGDPPAGEAAMSDKQLRQNVIDELGFEPSIDAANIGVLAEAGVVTLNGHVPTYAQKVEAERAAWRVRGVKAVVQDIEVRYAGSPASDDQIAKRALDVIRWNSTVPDDIHLTVNDGWITLSGEVDWQFQRTGAEESLRNLTGVLGITNNISLKSKAQLSVVRERIEDALKRNAELEARQIQVEIRDNGTVTLSGFVDNWSERRAVERAVWSAPGVKVLHDNLSIA